MKATPKLCMMLFLLLLLSNCARHSQFSGQIRRQSSTILYTLQCEYFSCPIPSGWGVYVKYGDTAYLYKQNSALRVMFVVYKTTDPQKDIARARNEALQTSDQKGEYRNIKMRIGDNIYEGIEFTAPSKGRNREFCSTYVVRQAEIVREDKLVVVACFLPDGKGFSEVDTILRHSEIFAVPYNKDQSVGGVSNE